ncbi:hypothetical protein FLONG3_9995 [Fusarium longipes]|uniref:EngB-type G domain-containing protein n=1 Tax=Fusarium longipes TaxID=694270 RepID=A0A395RSX7_9HYPO|nr:hypothetical protein FLONG3_9995 [Fusarium longipes]
MTPSRLFRASRIPCSFYSANSTQQKVAFCSSRRLGIRQRPLRRTSRASNSTQPVGISSDIPSSKNPVLAVGPKVQEAINHDALDASTAADLPNDPKVRKPKATKPKGPPPKGIKPHQQVLFQSESICFKQGPGSPVDVPKEDKPPLVAAGKFFEEGCHILYSAESLYHHPQNDHIPEIVVLGASNAGKSSFLNALVGGTEIAKVSHKPGKTTTMNAYGVGPRPKIAKELVRKGEVPPKHSLILMDTPGYGFKSQQDWGKTILKYLNVRKMLRGAVVLIPADKKLQETDIWMLRTLARSNTRTLVVITKADKPGEKWQEACHNLHNQIQDIIDGLSTNSAPSWRDGSSRTRDVYATASKIAFVSRRLGNGGGIGGVRLAILEMSGFSLDEKIEKQAETRAYSGKVVSFDDIVWKS